MSKFAEHDQRLSVSAVKCKLCREIAEMDKADAEFIRSLLAAPITEKGHKHVSNVLKAGGVDVSDTTVASCRSGGHQTAAADAA